MDIEAIMKSWSESIDSHIQIIEYVNEMIDKEADENREKWDKNIEHYSDLILDCINKLNKATSQIAILNGLIKTLQHLKGSIYDSMTERFKNEIN